MEQMTYREYLNAAEAPRAAVRKRKKRSVFAWQVLFSMLIGAVIWGLIAIRATDALSLISNNIKFNIEYSAILESMNNIWYTLTN